MLFIYIFISIFLYIFIYNYILFLYYLIIYIYIYIYFIIYIYIVFIYRFIYTFYYFIIYIYILLYINFISSAVIFTYIYLYYLNDKAMIPPQFLMILPFCRKFTCMPHTPGGRFTGLSGIFYRDSRYTTYPQHVSAFWGISFKTSESSSFFGFARKKRVSFPCTIPATMDR